MVLGTLLWLFLLEHRGGAGGPRGPCQLNHTVIIWTTALLLRKRVISIILFFPKLVSIEFVLILKFNFTSFVWWNCKCLLFCWVCSQLSGLPAYSVWILMFYWFLPESFLIFPNLLSMSIDDLKSTQFCSIKILDLVNVKPLIYKYLTRVAAFYSLVSFWSLVLWLWCMTFPWAQQMRNVYWIHTLFELCCLTALTAISRKGLCGFVFSSIFLYCQNSGSCWFVPTFSFLLFVYYAFLHFLKLEAAMLLLVESKP